MLPVLVPPERVKATVSPPDVSWFPFASFAVKVRVTAELEATVPEETETTDWDKETGPGVTVTVGAVLVTVLPPMVAWIVVAVPERTPVKVAV